MLGMRFLRLSKVLMEHKWTPSLGRKEIETARRKEDVLLAVVVVLFVGILLFAIMFDGG